MSISKARLSGLDVLRVLSVLVIFLFHSHGHIHCSYGVLNLFVGKGAIFMTAFFMLSGYVITYSPNSCAGGVIHFYKRRIISILPAYWILTILYTAYHIVDYYIGNHNDALSAFVKDSILLLPVEAIGLQSAFSSLFSELHNDGTWFVSCIIFCYMVFPLLKQITDELCAKSKVMLIAGLCLILIYSPIVTSVYGIEFLYTNIIFRIFEFYIGVLIASININSRYSKTLNNWTAFGIECMVLIAGVTIAAKLGLPHDFMLYNWIGLPCFIAMIITLSHIKSNKWIDSKTMSYACKISYMFFFAQFFTWNITTQMLNIIGLPDCNLIKIVGSFTICLIIAATLNKLLEEPLKNRLRKVLFALKAFGG